ncbi:hypothetical protein [Moorella stamsii]|uniref:hypothetical protein n=1 Tax=Neomoorella stamsii TaxID=1266720 RepID=UPI000AED8EFF|nr:MULTISPECIES: hypothetical protein [Moorella]
MKPNGLSRGKHAAVIGEVNRAYVKEGLLPREVGMASLTGILNTCLKNLEDTLYL